MHKTEETAAALSADERARRAVERWVREGGVGARIEYFLAQAIGEAQQDLGGRFMRFLKHYAIGMDLGGCPDEAAILRQFADSLAGSAFFALK